MYGLHQFPHAWNEWIDTYLQSIGLILCFSKPSLYVMITIDFILLLLFYFDDLMITLIFA